MLSVFKVLISPSYINIVYIGEIPEALTYKHARTEAHTHITFISAGLLILPAEVLESQAELSFISANALRTRLAKSLNDLSIRRDIADLLASRE